MAEFDLSASMNRLADMELWMDVIVVLGGFLAPTVMRNLVGGAVPNAIDHPEVYGLVLAVIAVAGDVAMGRDDKYGYGFHVAIGAGAHTFDALLDRFDVKQSIVNAGA